MRQQQHANKADQDQRRGFGQGRRRSAVRPVDRVEIGLGDRDEEGAEGVDQNLHTHVLHDRGYPAGEEPGCVAEQHENDEHGGERQQKPKKDLRQDDEEDRITDEQRANDKDDRRQHVAAEVQHPKALDKGGGGVGERIPDILQGRLHGVDGVQPG